MSQAESKPEKALPDEQQKREWEGDESELPAIIEEADEMREQMEEISYRTNPDGTLKGIVKAIHYTKEGGTIAVDIDLPAEADLERFHFKKPKAWTYNYDWVRFVESYGHRASSITSMIEDGVNVKVKRVDEDYELIYPTSLKYNIHRLKEYLGNPTRQSHPIWKMIPIGVGLYTGNWAYTGISSFWPIEIAAAVVLGTFGAAITGFILLVIGAALFGWENQ